MSGPNPPENGDASNSGDFGSSIPRPLNNTKNFRVLGDLILPSPSTCGLLQEHEELVIALRPHLDRMHTRDLSRISKPIQNLQHAFELFKIRESKVWKDLGLDPPHQDDFVSPSGSLSSGSCTI